MHALLARQLTRRFGSLDAVPPELGAFIESVNQAYQQADADRELLERSLDLSSRELVERYDALEKESEERRRSAEALERQLVAIEAAKDGIAIADAAGSYVFVNEAHVRAYGYDAASELLGKSWRTLCAPEDVARIEREILPLVARDGSWQGELTGRRRDGRSFAQEVSLTATRGGELVCIVRDISERKRLEHQLVRAQKTEAVGRLAGGLAHDFNNLLTAIIGHCDLLASDFQPGDPRAVDVASIRSAGERAARLTKRLLVFARQQVVDRRTVRLDELLLSLDRLLRQLVTASVELVILPAPALWNVSIDPSQLEQVVVNLAVNARDAMPEGGKLTIATENVAVEAGDAARPGIPPGEYVLLSVRDTGTGMTDEVKSRLFEPFFTTKGIGRGTGLGLATCYGIVRQVEGHIAVESEPGRGTRFAVYLPRATGAAPASAAGGLAAPLPRGSETVLLVEDEPMVRAIATRVLGLQGYTVIEAENGEEAIREIRDNGARIDILVTDVVMPLMGGPALLAHLARTGTTPRSVLFMSGYNDGGSLDPDVPFLQKPFSPEGLARAVRAALDAPATSAAGRRP